MTGAETEDDIPLGERKTVTDFCYLLDKSKQLFNGLRSVHLSEQNHLVLKVIILLQLSWSVTLMVQRRCPVINCNKTKENLS